MIFCNNETAGKMLVFRLRQGRSVTISTGGGGGCVRLSFTDEHVAVAAPPEKSI